MLDPDNKINSDSTWESPPRRQWILKFFASIALTGFLVGMMLGRIINPVEPFEYSNNILQLQSYADGLGVCLTRAAQVQASNQQGAYQLVFLDTRGQAAQGQLLLANDEPVRWRVEPQNEVVRVIFIGLQPVVGQWHQRSTDKQWCADIHISLASDSAQ